MSKSSRPSKSTSDRELIERLSLWFEASARDLPWRVTNPSTGQRDPYASLVSEFMLQQTQVSRVLEKFQPFIEKFPTVTSLAGADERDVMAMWSGLGYYRRARMLHAAAKAVRDRYQGRVPQDVEELMTLPGVGAYTAGAISSIVFGKQAPIVDGNVSRVLMRISALRGENAGSKEGQAWAWDRAGELAHRAAERAGVFNEAMMELGATVCLPRGPRCAECPVASLCEARGLGAQEEIPEPKPGAMRKALFSLCVLIRRADGALLVERRPSEGMWGGLWQVPTLECERKPSKKWIQDELLARLGLGLGQVSTIEEFTHVTTHRDVTFCVFGARAHRQIDMQQGERRWIRADEVSELGISSPQRTILMDLAREHH